jgi:hypothetical protein
LLAMSLSLVACASPASPRDVVTTCQDPPPAPAAAPDHVTAAVTVTRATYIALALDAVERQRAHVAALLARLPAPRATCLFADRVPRLELNVQQARCALARATCQVAALSCKDGAACEGPYEQCGSATRACGAELPPLESLEAT